MTVISVHRPTPTPAVGAQPFATAPRGRLPDQVRLVVVENSKNHAEALLTRVAERVARRLPVAEIEVVNKPSAGKPIDADLARMMAARSHLVITGLGD